MNTQLAVQEQVDPMEKAIVKKCWFFIYDNDHSCTGHIFGETLGKAKYQFYLDVDGYEFMEFFKGYSFKREPKMDLLEPVPMDIISTLTEKQLNVICHANGNDSRRPGHRSYFNRSDVDNWIMKSLVTLDLMDGPHKACGGSSYNWHLTEFGCLAAMSLLPIRANELNSTLEKRNQVIEWMVTKALNLEVGSRFNMRMFKVNPGLIKSINKCKVLIRSSQWGSYWRPNGSGYTERKSDAGVYDFEDAFLSTRHCGPEKGIYFQIAEQAVA
jgi:hypothetical protein